MVIRWSLPHWVTVRICISYWLLIHSKLPQKLSGLKQQFLWVKNSGIASYIIWLKVFYEVVVKILAGTSVIWRLEGARGWTVKTAHSHTWLVLVVCMPMFHPSPSGYLSVLATWQLACPRASDPRKRGRSHSVFYGLGLKVILHHFYSVLVTRSASLRVKRNYTRAWISGVEGHWGPS